MNAIEAFGIEDGDRVGGHGFDRELAAFECARANPAIVDIDEREAIREASICGRQPLPITPTPWMSSTAGPVPVRR